jgi:hypothetical protein
MNSRLKNYTGESPKDTQIDKNERKCVLFALGHKKLTDTTRKLAL